MQPSPERKATVGHLWFPCILYWSLSREPIHPPHCRRGETELTGTLELGRFYCLVSEKIEHAGSLGFEHVPPGLTQVSSSLHHTLHAHLKTWTSWVLYSLVLPSALLQCASWLDWFQTTVNHPLKQAFKQPWWMFLNIFLYQIQI